MERLDGAGRTRRGVRADGGSAVAVCPLSRHRRRSPGDTRLAGDYGGGRGVAGRLLVGWAAWRGLVHWQSIPSTWDAVWHANTVRFILDTGQASSTHMGELRNVETHAQLYYPSVFHALTAVYCQLTGAAPATGYTLTSVAASVWLFPSSAAMLTWFFARPARANGVPPARRPPRPRSRRRSPRCPTSSSVSPPCPTLAAYGVAIPTFVLIASYAAAPRPHPGGGARTGRRVLRPPHRRVRRHPVPGRVGGCWTRCGIRCAAGVPTR